MDIAQKLIDLQAKIRQDLLTAPLIGLAKVLPHMNLILGVRGQYIGGLLDADGEFRPYKTEKGAVDGGVAITPLEQYNYLGDVIIEFDPNKILASIWGEAISKKMTDLQIVTKVALKIAEKAGNHLYKQLFTAVRDANGTDTASLFNGFSTLVLTLITATDISAGNGNYYDASGTQMTISNCGDLLKKFVREADENLTDQDLKFFVPKAVLQMYEDWYQIEYGVQAWNNQGVNQKTLVGWDNVEFVPLSNMKDQDFLFLTLQNNTNILVDTTSDTENALIRQADNPKVVQFFMMAWFGVGFETIQKEFFKVMKFTTEVVGG